MGAVGAEDFAEPLGFGFDATLSAGAGSVQVP
jgi:hypothetical protein